MSLLVSVAFLLQIRNVLVVAPKNVLKNWIGEFRKWTCDVKGIPGVDAEEFTSSSIRSDRLSYLQNWKKTGGVVVLSPNQLAKLMVGKGSQEDDDAKRIKQILGEVRSEERSDEALRILITVLARIL